MKAKGRASNAVLLKKLQEAIDARNKAGELRRSFLRAAGWEYTSQTPDSRWRWCRMIAGKCYMLDEADALYLEEQTVS